MSERNITLLLIDIRSSILKILDYTQGMSYDMYDADSKTKDAVERNFEIIGEAASRLPDDFKSIDNGIEWRILKDFRNFIIHEYFGIDNLVVWDIIEHRLPHLLAQISGIIGSRED
jgi:uncharacterized protein with HEPN domain